MTSPTQPPNAPQWPTNPYPSPPEFVTTPAPKKKPKRWPWIVGGAIVLVLLLCAGLGAALSGGSSDKPQKAKPLDPPATTAAAVVPPTAAPTKAAPAPTKAAAPKPVIYKTITDRQWALIAKNPDAHVGEDIIVYGQVTQFDAATGDDAMLADMGGKKRVPEYGYVDYPTNTMLVGTAKMLSSVVEGDLITVKATVVGSYSYDTQIGGNTTVPALQVASIKVTGSAN